MNYKHKPVAGFLITIAAIIAAVGIGLFFNDRAGDKSSSESPAITDQQSNLEPTSAQEPNQVAAEVTFTEEAGFQPSEVTIELGQAVRFAVPESAEVPVWVASNPHPEHTDYPEFDAARILDALPSPGEGYSFTFDQAGSWQYHNHTAPDFTGVINVKE